MPLVNGICAELIGIYFKIIMAEISFIGKACRTNIEAYRNRCVPHSKNSTNKNLGSP